uniref:Programmed cell death protein 5 n=2 Tax=Parascaris univalens TaxID=6257 RepID=A0A915CH26_PARUN
MADTDLEAIRARRLAQIQGDGTGSDSDVQSKAEQARKAAEQQENMKNSILSQVLDQSAMARLSNLTAAKPEKAAMVENMIIQMARMGQIAGKMNDETLKELLDRISERTQKTTTVKFDRRRAAIDSDSD